jgi:L-threonylcarbamoyladenylate synthase
VYNDLKGADGLGCILDGGDCGVGVESTVVNGLAWREGGGGVVDILRPGGLGVEEVEKVVREVDGEGRSTEILVHGKPWQRNAQASSSKLPIVRPDQPNGHDKSAVHILKNEQTASPSTPGMKYRHYSPRVPVFLLLPSNTFPKQPISHQDHSPGAIISSIASSLASPNNGRKGLSIPRLGILHYDGSPLSASLVNKPPLGVELVMMSLGPDSTSAAQRLFSGMLSLEGSQSVSPSASDAASTLSLTATPPGVGRSVDAILIEGCTDEGLGLAVMERVGKAVGGGGKVGELSIGEGLGDSGRFWVQV